MIIGITAQIYLDAVVPMIILLYLRYAEDRAFCCYVLQDSCFCA